jgi:hypothetical protein
MSDAENTPSKGESNERACIGCGAVFDPKKGHASRCAPCRRNYGAAYRAKRLAAPWRLDDATQERFWSKVDKSGDCWLWRGNCVDGYGRFYDGRRNRIASQVAWEIVAAVACVRSARERTSVSNSKFCLLRQAERREAEVAALRDRADLAEKRLDEAVAMLRDVVRWAVPESFTDDYRAFLASLDKEGK